MALPTPEQLADPEFIRQFVDAAMSDGATARTLDMVSGKLWEMVPDGDKGKYTEFTVAERPCDLNEAALEAIISTTRLDDGTIAVRATYAFVQFELTPADLAMMRLDRNPICLVCVPPDAD